MPVEWCAGPEDALDGAVRIENLYELAQHVASARVFVGNDSGITHLAAAVQTPVVALFGPADPRVWAPRGSRVTVVAKPEIGQITVQEVVEAAQRLYLP
jgi:ADP-heptose:LPS heptosyltransferase